MSLNRNVFSCLYFSISLICIGIYENGLKLSAFPITNPYWVTYCEQSFSIRDGFDGCGVASRDRGVYTLGLNEKEKIQ